MRVESGGREGKEFGKSLAVIAADPERGRDLAARLEECGFRVTRIVGPEEAADLLRSGGVAVAEGEVAAAEMDRSILTGREREVLVRMARGFPDKGIADELGIGVRTVRFHIDHILRKLHAQNRTEAVAKSMLPREFL
ncbi:MAG: hypothetical protein A2Z99_02170 [Treponema sp. GWB1_62_6]|nr:MAG: hypothetical protein A2Y36_10230 [Treponema sp. GWA1_62_8]OHE65288.1 MAG: hypothetical protein A2001_03515 [Treponema sp. GWC1_61_84]OHE69681.1 MAG: hypothetical protein A2Z99_02170 [Treponema sp. GWB1_62_6]HCM28900.1 helix-turn-helix transcriptional regulator [Treponema sp.]